ncbi:MAG: DUF3825 domain-containing protein [Bacteroidales bacterium]|nr:DUF3825 domain-containing protein [Bacteroidales bacterium]
MATTLNTQQRDCIFRCIKALQAEKGEVRLVKLSSEIIKQHIPGLSPKENWLGHKGFRKMLEAHPEYFETYGDSTTDKRVRLKPYLAATEPITAPCPTGPDMNFDVFVKANVPVTKVRQTCEDFCLGNGLEEPCVFRSVLRFAYHKAKAEGKVLEVGNIRFFHTSWYNDSMSDIFCMWGYQPDGSSFIVFLTRDEKDTRKFIKIFGNRFPEPITFEKPIFNTELPIGPEFGHYFDERADRIPDDVIAMLNPGNSDVDKTEIVSRNRNFLRRLFIGSIEDTRERLSKRLDEAVLFWDRRRDNMCWLIPLRLGLSEKPNLALVLEETTLNEVPLYRAHTILALREAFKSARLLGPVRADWLKDVIYQ